MTEETLYHSLDELPQTPDVAYRDAADHLFIAVQREGRVVLVSVDQDEGPQFPLQRSDEVQVRRLDHQLLASPDEVGGLFMPDAYGRPVYVSLVHTGAVRMQWVDPLKIEVIRVEEFTPADKEELTEELFARLQTSQFDSAPLEQAMSQMTRH